MPAIKIVDFTSGQSELFYLQKWSGDCDVSLCVPDCLHLVIEEVKKMSSDSESNSFANFWSSCDEDILGDDEDDVEESSNTQTDVTRCAT